MNNVDKLTYTQEIFYIKKKNLILIRFILNLSSSCAVCLILIYGCLFQNFLERLFYRPKETKLLILKRNICREV